MQTVNLTQGCVALIDDEDAARVNQIGWYAAKIGKGVYGVTNIKREDGKSRTLTLHRFILQPPDGMHVDHINGVTLDNRKENLRICTPAQNARNQARRDALNRTSQYKGVSWYKNRGCWRSQIMYNGVLRNIGHWNTQEAAALAYNVHAQRLHGEFAKINELPDTAEAIIAAEIAACKGIPGKLRHANSRIARILG